MSFAVFALLTLAAIVAACRLVPKKRVIAYHQSVDEELQAAVFVYNSIWTVAGIQYFLSRDVPLLELQILGALMFAGGQVLIIAAWRANPFFLPVIVYVRPEDRVKDGVYRLRHPAYIGMIISSIGMCLLFGQSWAIAPAILYCGMIFYRIFREEQCLRS